MVLAHDTRGPADTVAQTISRARNRRRHRDQGRRQLLRAVAATRHQLRLRLRRAAQSAHDQCRGKSFAVVNGEGLIVDMVEKSLASNHVSVGLYGFSDAARFLEAFDAVASANRDGEVFVSHVMSRAIRDGLVVKPHAVEGLIDVGTLDDWRRYTRTRGTIVADIDGVVFRNHSRYSRAAVGRAGRADSGEHRHVARLGRRRRPARLHDGAAEEHRSRTEAALRSTGSTIRTP